MPRLPITLAAAIVLLAGCVVERSYRLADDGAERTSELTVPYHVTVVAVDGRDLNTGYLFYDQRPQVLTLGPGEHTVVLRYFDLLEDDEGAQSDSERVTSEPVRLRFTAEPGRAYRLAAPRPDTLAAARRYARAPEMRIEPAGGGAAVSEPAPAPAPESPAAAAGPETSASAPTALEMLEYWWQQASPAQRRRFLEAREDGAGGG